mmetsp:Transcript_113884/g.318133  ORF Transcript_113884/g.318133 Transcript_113884/m.318133 type:complete len:98 (+) Transcript_113884:32-325(+)
MPMLVGRAAGERVNFALGIRRLALRCRSGRLCMLANELIVRKAIKVFRIGVLQDDIWPSSTLSCPTRASRPRASRSTRKSTPRGTRRGTGPTGPHKN